MTAVQLLQVGYVEQMDVHTPAQTVREALWFSGRLRLGAEVSDEQVRWLTSKQRCSCTARLHNTPSQIATWCP